MHNREVTARRRAGLHAAGVDAVDSVWTPLGAPRPGEWLFHHPEDGQTFASLAANGPPWRE